jgi:hypothetical protein
MSPAWIFPRAGVRISFPPRIEHHASAKHHSARAELNVSLFSHEGISDGVVTRMALTLREHLQGLPNDALKVPTKRLKDALRIQPEQLRTFRRAVEQLAAMCPEWARVGHSLVRADAAYHRFTAEG